MENKVSMWMHGPLQKAQDALSFDANMRHVLLFINRIFSGQ